MGHTSLCLTAGAIALAMTSCGAKFTAAETDGGTDGATSLLEAGGDAPSDAIAADAPVDAGGSFCATHTGHTFCEDFDEYANIGAALNAWAPYVESGGSFTLPSSPMNPSPPNALAVSAASSSKTLVLQTFPAFAQPPTKLHLDFALRVDEAANVGILAAAAFANILMGTTVEDGAVSIAAGSGSSLIANTLESSDAGANSKPQNATTKLPAAGQWAGRFSLEIDFSTTASGRTGCVQIYASAVALLNPCLPLPASMVNPRQVSIALGVYSGGDGNTGNVGVEFDDVTFDIM